MAYVGYRLLPRHPFPAGLLDGYAALKDLAERCHGWDCDAGRMAVVGDSAGGNIAAAVCLLARDRGGPAIWHQVLIYPPLDATLSSPSLRTNLDDPMLSAGGIASTYADYAASARPDEGLLSPLLATSVSKLPGATLFAAGLDHLRDDAIRYAQRLQQAGVAAECIELHGVPHMGFHMRGVSVACARIYDTIGDRLLAALNN